MYIVVWFGGFGGGFGVYDYLGFGFGSDLGFFSGLSSVYGGGNFWFFVFFGGGYGGLGLGILGGGLGSYGFGGLFVLFLRGFGMKIFVGRLFLEVNVEDLWCYFNNFGRIFDVYVFKVWLMKFGGINEIF